MSTGGASREVLFTLKVVDDPNAKAVFERIGKYADQATAAMKRAVEQQTQVVKQEAERQEQIIKRASGEAVKVAKQEADARKAFVEAYTEAREKEEIKALHRFQKVVREQRQAAAATIQEYQRYGTVVEQQNQRVVTSLKQASEGAMSLVRGFALLGLSGEKDLQKVLDAIIKIEAGVAIGRGTLHMIENITKAYKAYAAAVQAASAAEEIGHEIRLRRAAGYIGYGGVAAGGSGGGGRAAGSFAGGAGGAAAAGGGGALTAGAGGAALTIGAFVAAVASAAGAITVIVEEISRIASGGLGSNNFGSATSAIGGIEAGIGKFIARYHPDFMPGTTSYGQAVAAEDRVGRMEGRRNARRRNMEETERGWSEFESNEAQRRGFDYDRRFGIPYGRGAPAFGQDSAARASRDIFANRQQQNEAYMEMSGAGSDQERLQLQQRILELKKEELQLQARSFNLSEQEAQTRLNAAQQELQLRQDILDRAMGYKQSAAEQFALMNPMDQQEISSLVKKFQADPNSLTPQQLDRIRGFVPEGEAGRRISEIGQAAPGFAPIGAGLDQGIAGARREVDAARIAVETSGKIVVELQADAERISDQLSGQIQKISDNIVAKLQKAFEEALQRANQIPNLSDQASAARRRVGLS